MNLFGKYAATGAALLLGSLLSVALVMGQGADWKAPAEADGYQNPAKADGNSVAEGKKVYEKYCLLCHGATGKGDGASSGSLEIKPADFGNKAKMKDQSDGALAWKIISGRGPMPAWGPVLQETEIWNVINYIRTFSK